MNKGKLIVIEGTEYSGKNTQTKLLVERLKSDNVLIERSSFPMYDSPTGTIINSYILGRDGNSTFAEGMSNIPPKVASLYYAADRLYNIDKIINLLNSGINVILDRYVESNMGYQVAKLDKKTDKLEMLNWLEKLEYEMLELPKPDLVIFLYMPYQFSMELREKELGILNERIDIEYLKNTEATYSMVAEKYNYSIIHCVNENSIRGIKDINDEIFNLVKEKLNVK